MIKQMFLEMVKKAKINSNSIFLQPSNLLKDLWRVLKILSLGIRLVRACDFMMCAYEPTMYISQRRCGEGWEGRRDRTHGEYFIGARAHAWCKARVQGLRRAPGFITASITTITSGILLLLSRYHPSAFNNSPASWVLKVMPERRGVLQPGKKNPRLSDVLWVSSYLCRQSS